MITDREYSCVSLALRLLDMGYYTIGTVTPSRLGFPKGFKWPWKKPPKRVERGHYKLAVNKSESRMTMTAWVDSKAVYLVSTGCSARKTTVKRKMKNGEYKSVPCPTLVDSYNKYMSGVDNHDQLRLQRFVY